MVDNFEQIKRLMKFENPEDFYFVQVIQRKKDHKDENKRLGRNNNARLVKAYYIYSIEQLDEYREEMIELAKLFNARVGINLNKRSNIDIAYQMLEQLAACLKSKNYNLSKLYNSCCGMVLGNEKLWLVDVDTKEVSPLMLAYIENDCDPIGPKIIAQIPTKNGVHVITRSFNSKKFSEKYPEIEIHKNNPTVLYVP